MAIDETKVLYEDNHIIVVIKDENILSQGDITNDENMVDNLKEYLKVKYNKPGNVFVGLVNRTVSVRISWTAQSVDSCLSLVSLEFCVVVVS